MSFSRLNLMIDGRGIAFLTLNRPEKHNAFDQLMVEELLKVLEYLNRLNHVRIVILKAAGKHFSAGADLEGMQRMAHSTEEENLADASLLAKLMHVLYTLPKVTIALAQGGVYGGGVGLIACCDLALANTHTLFCLSEVKVGLIPAVISPYVVRAIGERQARRYFLTAEKIDAQKALALNLVHEVVEPSMLLEQGYQLAKQILCNAPQALQAAKQFVQEVANTPFSNMLMQKTVAKIANLRVSEEAQEGVQAFLEKRTPRWVRACSKSR